MFIQALPSCFLPFSVKTARSFFGFNWHLFPAPSLPFPSLPAAKPLTTPPFLPPLPGAIPGLCEADSSSLSIPAPWLLLCKAIPRRLSCASSATQHACVLSCRRRPSLGRMHALCDKALKRRSQNSPCFIQSADTTHCYTDYGYTEHGLLTAY